jgi:hypothetical protein
MSIEMERHYITHAKQSLDSTILEIKKSKTAIFKLRKDLEKQRFIQEVFFCRGTVRQPDLMIDWIEKQIDKFNEKVFLLEAEVHYWQHVLEKV